MLSPTAVYVAGSVLILAAVAVLLTLAWAWLGAILLALGLAGLWRAETARQDTKHAEFLRAIGGDHDDD